MKKLKYGFLVAFITIIAAKQLIYAQANTNVIQGKMKGVVELGSEGFNSFVITLDKSKNWKLEKAEYGNSNVLEGMATEASVLEGLKKYIKGFIDFGVNSRDIHFVTSSGAQIMRSTTLIIQGLETLGYQVNKVTPEEEGELAFICVMPNADKNKAHVIDVGSGNTKVSWMEDGKIVTKSTYGSKYYLDFVEDDKVYEESKEIGKIIPKNFISKVYLLGGVPYKFAKQTRKNKERYTRLGTLELYEPANDKQKAGQKILQGLRDGSGSDIFIFDWDSNFTIGFLLTLDY